MRAGWDLWAPSPVSRGKAGGEPETGHLRQWTWAGVSLACIYSEAMKADDKEVAFVIRSQRQRPGQSGSLTVDLAPSTVPSRVGAESIVTEWTALITSRMGFKSLGFKLEYQGHITFKQRKLSIFGPSPAGKRMTESCLDFFRSAQLSSAHYLLQSSIFV